MKKINDFLVNESNSDLITRVDELEYVLCGLENIYKDNEWHEMSKKKVIKALYKRLYDTFAEKIDKDYFADEGFGFGDIDKINNRY